MKILNKVTVTGAGDGIYPQDLWGIQSEYPFAEFGILLSKSHSMEGGSVRFPSRAWLAELVRQRSKLGPLSLSGHLCGDWVRGVLVGNMVDLDEVVPGLSDVFQRFQINTHAEPHEWNEGLIEVLAQLAGCDQSAIFQIDGKDGSAIAKEIAAQDWENAAGLFDLSHGAGVLAESWPKPIPGLFCGYAGGLSPENVAEQLAKIETLTSATWIDAETSLFRRGRFDLGRVKGFLEAARPWTIHQQAT